MNQQHTAAIQVAVCKYLAAHINKEGVHITNRAIAIHQALLAECECMNKQEPIRLAVDNEG